MKLQVTPARPASAESAGVLLQLKNFPRAIGCDLGGTNLKLVRLGPSGLEATSESPTPGPTTASAMIRAITGQVKAMLPKSQGHWPLGIAVPGFLDESRERIVRLSNLPALSGVALGHEVARKLRRVGAILDADTNAAAHAEATVGSGGGKGRVLYVTMGTGLGAALVVAGEIVRVSRHTVGQVAHLPLGERGHRCYCGAVGCAETLLSARGILLRARRSGIAKASSTLELFELATRRGPRRARATRLWRETGGVLGKLLQILAALFSPDRIVIGGGVAGAAELFLPDARAWLSRSLTPALSPEVSVEAAALGRFSGAIGAALLAARVDRA